MTRVVFYFIYLFGLLSPLPPIFSLFFFSNISVLKVRLERICDPCPFGDTTYTHKHTYKCTHIHKNEIIQMSLSIDDRTNGHPSSAIVIGREKGFYQNSNRGTATENRICE